ncbi:MAG: hypothetical protein ACOYLS_14945 [Polymorphobacter sp.]
MRMKLCTAVTALLAGAALAQPVLADELIAGGNERFKFKLGGIVARIDSGIGIDGTAGAGTIIDLDGQIGKKEANNVFFGAEWRIGSRHRVTGTYFTTKKNRALNIDQKVTIGDDTLVPPTTLASESKNRFLFATYEYSFVKNQDVEIAGLLGAYINKFSAELSGSATVQNSNGTTTINKTVAYKPSVTVPMPLIGASINWFASPRFSVGGSLSGLKAKIGDVDGSVYVATVSAEYMFTRNIGAGVAYMHTDADVDITKKSFVGSIDWKNDNILAYALLKF